MKITVGNELLEVQITRSRRKTWEIRITPDGNLCVRGPLKMTDKKFLELIQTKSGWVMKKTEELRKRPNRTKARNFTDGEVYPYRGMEYPLIVNQDPGKSRVTVCLTDETFQITAPDQNTDTIRTALEKWCRQQAGRILPERVRALEIHMGLKCGQVTVKDQKKRWGSCSSRGNVNLNWRLVQMPQEVMDSVIIHELAHLVHQNHSADYYRYLGLHNPDYKDHDRWLKERGKELFT